MKYLIKIQLLLLLLTFSSCAQKSSSESGKVDTYKNVKTQLKGTEADKLNPKANIGELEMEVNNGGFNQYFINSGQNCYETLKALKKNGKVETAKLLESAINLINPNHTSENDFVEKLRKREVEELYNDKISAKLNKLDVEFYKYKDGSLTEE
jgi:ABC-type oligopeptide transport system substrate-binding subunit